MVVAQHHPFENGAAFILKLLLQHGDACALTQADGTAVIRFFMREDAKEGGLAHSIFTDEPYPVPGPQMKIDGF